MCSGCSGDYEGDGDQAPWGSESTLASSGDTVDGGACERDKSNWFAAHGTHVQGRNETRKQTPADEYQAESEYEVFVSADEIIEIRRITGDFAGL
jgi:hypothetical protein